MSEKSFTAFRVFNENGLQLTLSFPLACETVNDFSDSDAQAVKRAIATAVANGFLLEQPGAIAGEKIETIGSFCRRAKLDRNGDEVAAIDFYPLTDNPEVKYKMITMYLNTPDDVADFERHTGLEVAAMPFYDGDAPLERTSPKAPKYLVAPVVRPLKIALVDNPAYDEKETDPKKKKPKYKFSRWFSGETQAADETGQSAQAGNKPVEHWAVSELNRQRIVEAFAAFGVKGREAIAAKMALVEPGIAKLSESKIASADAYITRIQQVLGKAATEVEEDVPF